MLTGSTKYCKYVYNYAIQYIKRENKACRRYSHQCFHEALLTMLLRKECQHMDLITNYINP